MTAALALTFSFAYSRLGFDLPVLPLLRVMGMAGLIFGLPALLYIFTGKIGGWRGPWLLSQPMIVLLILLLLGVSGWVSLRVSQNLFTLPAWLGLLCAGLTYVIWLSRGYWVQSLILLLFTVILAVGVLDQRHPALLPEMLIDGGGHIDNVFHAAYSNMLVTYGVPSTGLEGLPYVPNHYFSHWLFGHLAVLLQVDTITFYVLGYPAIFCSLTLMCFAMFAGIIRRLYIRPDDNWILRLDWLFWMLLFFGIYGVLSLAQQRQVRLDLPRLFRSESQTVGVAFTLISASILAIYYHENKHDLGRITWNSIGFLLVALPLLCVLVGLTKISQLSLSVVVLGWLWLRLRMFRSPLLVLALIVNLVAAGMTYMHVNVTDPEYSRFELFYLFRVAVSDDGKPTFFLLNFAWSWVVIILCLARAQVRSLNDLWRSLRQGQLLLAEIVLVASAAGFAVVSVIAFSSGSSVLFLNYQRWLALPLVMAFAGEIRQLLPSRYTDDALRSKLGGVSLLWIGTVLIAGVLVWQAMTNMQYRVGERARSEERIRALVGDMRPGFLEAQIKNVLDRDFVLRPEPGKFAAVINAQPWAEIHRVFEEIADLPYEVKRQSVLFIPRENTLYWEHRPCNEIPFYAPALTGLAMLDGLPLQSCQAAQFYGYGMYNLTDDRLNAADSASLCQAAATWGLRRVEVVEEHDNIVIRRSIICDEIASD